MLAWPIGEDRELRLWLRALKGAPFAGMCAALALLLVWMVVLPVKVDAEQIRQDPVVRFWWDSFCEDTTAIYANHTKLPNEIRTCRPIEWLLPCVIVVLLIPYALFR